MKIADVLSFMNIQMSFSWSNDSDYPCDYSPEVDISKIPVKYNEGYSAPANEEFHKAAQELISINSAHFIKARKREEYPDIYDWLLALTEEVGILADRFEIPVANSFIATREKIKQVEEAYKNS